MSFLLAAPALPIDEAGKYVAAAYIVFVLLLVIYIGIMAAKLGRISRELDELADLAEGKAAGGGQGTANGPEQPVGVGSSNP